MSEISSEIKIILRSYLLRLFVSLGALVPLSVAIPHYRKAA